MSRGGHGDTYGYDSDDLAFFERFTLEPVTEETIQSHLDREEYLSSLDIPAHLDRQLVTGTETGVALYRLVQLFGTPNVPGLTAGRTQRERETTTWHYLFRVSFDRENDDTSRRQIENAPEEFLLSVYDYKTNVSTGLSAWDMTDEEIEVEVERIREPVDDPAICPEVSPPSDDFLVSVVQLVLNMIEEPVPATFKGLWV